MKHFNMESHFSIAVDLLGQALQTADRHAESHEDWDRVRLLLDEAVRELFLSVEKPL